MTGGVMAQLQGGKFGNGFVSAAGAELASPYIDSIGGGKTSYAGARVAAAALVGGTVSVLTGGKFASGALTAAFSRAFNSEGSPRHRYRNGQIKRYQDEDGLSEHVLDDAYEMASEISNGGKIRALDEDGDGDNSCAELIKVAFKSPNARDYWRQGRAIAPGMDINPGTAIATFDESGRYPGNKVLAKHAAIFVAFSPDGKGILVLDQYESSPSRPGDRFIKYRLLPWVYNGSNPHSSYVNSASSFSTIRW